MSLNVNLNFLTDFNSSIIFGSFWTLEPKKKTTARKMEYIALALRGMAIDWYCSFALDCLAEVYR